jgi:sortase A
MVERTGKKLELSSLNRFEQVALFSTILIWAGVVAFGVGLFVALYNLRADQIVYAKVAATPTTAVETVLPTPAAQLFPAGWSTATPTPTRAPTRERAPSDTRVPMATVTSLAASSSAGQSTGPLSAPTLAPPPSLYPPDRLVIPTIKLDSPVVPIGWMTVEQNGQTSRVWSVVDQVVGWHKTSAYPGSVGNVVLNGHHNIKGEVFRYLVDVEVGDRVIVYARDQVHYYAVTEKHILKEKGEPIEVRQQNARWIGTTTDERLTMITCWPYTNNTHRLIVLAKPTSAPELEEPER